MGTINVTGIPQSDNYITNGYYTGSTLTLNNNTGGTIVITGFSTGITTQDTYITAIMK